MPKSFQLRLHGHRTAPGVPAAALRALILFLLNRARHAEPARPLTELDVVLTGHDGIRQVNQAAFGKDSVTDVIAMTYAPDPVRPGWSGELIVNAALARELGPRFGGAGRELALYLAHGCDHLTGGTDDTPAERARMRRRELRWLAAAARAGLIDALEPPREKRS